MKTEVKPETVGRTYEFTRYSVLCRRIGGDGVWYGRDNYKTEEEARDAFAAALKHLRFEDVGGITVDYGPDNGDRYERKLVKVVKQCEVLAVGVGPA